MKTFTEPMPIRNQKLRELIDSQFNGNVSEFAKTIGKSQQVINRLFSIDKRSGKYPTISNEIEKAILAKVDVREDYFDFQISSPEVEPKRSPVYNVSKIAESLQATREPYNIKTKPHLPVNAVAGLIGEYYNGIHADQCERSNVINQFPQYDFTMSINGDSMEPNLHHGDIIACHQIFKTIQWGGIYLIDTNDGAFVKKIEEEGDSIRCISLNKDYKDFLIEKSDVRGFYEVVGVLRTRI